MGKKGVIIIALVALIAGAVTGGVRYWHSTQRASITEIEAEIQFEWGPDVISGKIITEKPCNYDEYKVVAYVKTDIWYVHPWVGTFASINKDGSWELESVNRTPSPTQVGVFLIDKDYVSPPLVENPLKDLNPIASSLKPFEIKNNEK